MANKGNLLLKLKHVRKVFIILVVVVVVVCTFCGTNISAAMSSAGFHNPLHNQLHSPRHMCCGDVTVKVIWFDIKKTDFYFDGLLWTLETVKRSWSDSQSSSGDAVRVFMSSLKRQVRFSVCVCVCKRKTQYIISACELSIAGSRSVKEIGCTTACHSTAALLQTGTSTSILTLHIKFLSTHYLSRLSFSGEHEQ